MSTMSLKIVKLMENPFYISDIIAKISKNYKKRNLNLWEIYIVIPLFFNLECREIFMKTNSTGRIEKLFLKRDDLLEIIFEEKKYYEKIINTALIISINQNKILLNKLNGEIKFKKFESDLDPESEKILKTICGVLSKEKLEFILGLLGRE